MVERFIESYVAKIATNPESIAVVSALDEDKKICNIIIYASESDVGRIIGKSGKMISAIKTVVSACKAKNALSYKIIVEAAKH